MANIGDLFLTLLADGSRLVASVKAEAEKAGDAGAKTLGQRLSQGLTGVGKSLTSTGKSWTQNITLPILGAGAAIFKVGADFDTSLRQIIALTDTTAGEIDGIRTNLLKLATEVGKTPDELAQGFYFLASAGFNTAEAMEVLNSTAKASAAGLGSTADISRIVGAAINAFGKENLTAEQAVDQLLRAIKDGTAEAPEFAGALGDVLGTAGQLGATFADTTAAIAAMTLKGIGADEAATSLNQVFVSLLKTTPKAEAALNDVGLSSEELRKQLREKGLLAVLQSLSAAFEGNDTAASEAFGNVRALRGILALTSGDAAKTASVFEDVANGTANLADAFEATNGPGREFDKAIAEAQILLIELSTDVLPVVVDLLRTVRGIVGGVVGAFKSLPGPVRTGIVQLAALAAAIGPLLFVSGKVATGMGKLIGAFRLAGAAAKIAGPAIAKLGAGIAARLGTALAGNAAVAAIGEGLGSAIGRVPGSAKVAAATTRLGTFLSGRLSKIIGIGLVAAVAAAELDYVQAQAKNVDLLNEVTRKAGQASLDQLLAFREQLRTALQSERGKFDPIEDFFGLSQQSNLERQLEALNSIIATKMESGAKLIGDQWFQTFADSTRGAGGSENLPPSQQALDAWSARLTGQAKQTGKAIPGSVAAGVLERQSVVTSAMDTLRNLMKNALGRKQRIFRDIGVLTGKELEKGLNDRRAAVRKEAEHVLAVTVGELEKLIESGGKVGKDGMRKLRLAMKSENPQVRAAATHVYQIVKGTLDKTPAAAGTAGTKAGERYASGLQRGINNLPVTAVIRVSSAGGSQTRKRSQTGGFLAAGQPSWINEVGKEIFVPSASGRVISHAQSVRAVKEAAVGGGGGGNTYNIPLAVQGALPVRTIRDFQTEMRRLGEMNLLPDPTVPPRYRTRGLSLGESA